ncbi:MAG: carboxypeptidase-like regulatory domain-containing protein [bacterium]
MKHRQYLTICVLLCFAGIVFAGGTGQINGSVRDAETGDPLPGANVLLQGTAIGAATDLDGEYRIPRVSPGNYTLVVSFIGYKKMSMPVKVVADETAQINAELHFEVIEGKKVVVTAQLEGQAQAINQQLSSNTIVNVVSADRIQELPDANAAESVGRLPGISIKRSGGEGNKVVIRGLSPTYNSITVGGVRIPATDLEDRSVDMSMISPEILAGIEVTKVLTPDKDADAFGGTVNFKLADAPIGGYRQNFRFYQGYNAQRDEPGQYKGSAILSNRF